MKKGTKITYIWHRALMTIVFALSALGTLFNKDSSVKGEYLFVCVQSGLFLILTFLPSFLNKLDLDIPDFIYIIFILFCIAHFLCGEILGFFVKIKWWDSLLHTFSGMIIALLSFSLINLLNNYSKNFKLNIWFAAIFAFALTITIGVVWEIIEYTSDLWFNSNMQRAYVSTLSGRGEALLGQAALADTMKDLMLDALGAGLTCTLCIIAVYKKKINIEDLSFIKKRTQISVVHSDSIEHINFQKDEINSNSPSVNVKKKRKSN